MVSERKRAANRANAKKSTGPKSKRGKKKSSRNALTHGLMSNHMPVLPFENEFEYRMLLDAVQRDLKPVGIVQREMVSHIALLMWKLRRIPTIEQALLETDLADFTEQYERNVEEGEMEP